MDELRAWLAARSTPLRVGLVPLDGIGDAGPFADVLVHGAQGIERSQLRATVQRYAGQLQYCYERALKDNPTLAGRIEVSWTMVPTGQVAGARVASTPRTTQRCRPACCARWSGGCSPPASRAR